MNVQKAITFVKNQGNPVEQARLNYILHRQRPPQAAFSQLFADQQPDGGWAPFWANDCTSLDATCYRLAQADQLGLTGSVPAIQHALSFLARRQSADGSWQEDNRMADFAPAWAKPGDLPARLYITANCGLWLAFSDSNLEKAENGAAYLVAHLDPNDHLPGFLHTHWLAAGLWRKLGWNEPAGRVCKYLDGRLHDLVPSNLSWLIITLRKAGFPTSDPLLVHAANKLELGQQSLGNWSSEDGTVQDVHATLEALLALKFCGRE
jgi:hypothetical protein